METPTGYEEREMYENKILKDGSGSGTIYVGKYYMLDYQPSRENSWSLKCDGIMLITRRIKDKYSHDLPSYAVMFKSHQSGTFWKLVCPDVCKKLALPFKDRLQLQIDECIKKIKEKEKHLAAVEATADKITACQRKIDKTMSEFKMEEQT